MKTWNSIDEVLDFAIAKELEASEFYLELSRQSTRQSLRELLEGFSHEELGHKAKLEQVKRERMLAFASNAVADLELSESLLAPNPMEIDQLDYASALILAMNAEKAAFDLYSELARVSEQTSLRELFLSLAQEEARHKLRFEVEYDEFVLTEN